ncbi:zinc transporter ZupT [Trueperella sp. LYQ143]|uniref:zinc transporter ZupT n=1 Tax=unclassified Trueperella TaxID=2630174 RepID=UPI003982E390
MSGEVMAWFLTLLAGLATGIGAACAFIVRQPTPKLLSISLGFSAGVMLYVSLVEILPEARTAISHAHPNAAAYAVGAFFAGIGIIAAIDAALPEFSNPHEFHNTDQFLRPPGAQNQLFQAHPQAQAKLMRMGLFTAGALALHNFPEGFATFLSAIYDVKIAIPIAVAIAIHNIPEGIAVAMPIYYATGSRIRAFVWSFISGLSEPIGALIGWLILRDMMSDTVFGLVFAAVAGIMVYISLDELLPSAEEFGQHHHAIGGLIAGMGVMAASLLLLE